MPYGMSFSITTAKTPFLSSPLISLYYKSIKEVSYTRTNMSIGGDCLTDVPAEVRQFSVMGFLRGRLRLRFAAGLVGLVGFQGTSRVGKGASSLSVSVVASSLSSLAVASSSSSSTLQVFLGRKQGFTDVLLKLVGPLGSQIQHILFSIASKQQGPV